jgi:hypothetical protein
MLAAAEMPTPTPEYEALPPRAGETGLDALTRIGDEIVQEVGGSDTKDSRKDKKLPRQLAALVALRAQGFDNREIAEKMNVSPQKLRALIQKARRDFGWDDLADRLANVAIPLAMESTIKHIEFEGSPLGVIKGQSTMTRAALAGVGIFKSHSAAKQEVKKESTTTLRVEIALPELPPGVQGAEVAAGSVLATPRRALATANPTLAATVEGEVVNG